MKKLFLCLMLGSWQYINTEAMTFAVPKQCLVGKSSLVLDMLDDCGKKCVGLCQLDEQFVDRTIMKRDLQIKTENIFDQLSEAIDVTHASQPCAHEVLLRIECDKGLRILRILLIQDKLLENDLQEVSIFDLDDQDDFDELSALIDGVDVEEISANMPTKHLSRFEEYSLYLKLCIAMQYSYAKRTINNMMSWFYSNN